MKSNDVIANNKNVIIIHTVQQAECCECSVLNAKITFRLKVKLLADGQVQVMFHSVLLHSILVKARLK